VREPAGQIECPADPALLADRARRLLIARSGPAAGRVIVGIAGAPGAGKSTLARQVVAAYGPDAVLVGMDGFHLAQAVLADLALVAVKGAPETFDAAGYLALLERLTEPPNRTVIYAPEFRREIEEPIAGAVPIRPEVQVIVTEGNYLLLDAAPWRRVRSLLAETWFLDTPPAVRVERLARRHVEFGRAPDVALDRALHGSDGRNAELVLASRSRATVLLR